LVKPPYTLCLDQGGHASRAMVFDGAGTLVSQCFAPIGTRRTPEGHVEHDADQIIESFRDVLTDLDGQLPGGVAIASAGLATQRSSIVCWDRESGKPLSPVISWQDRRNAAFVETLADRAAWVHARTGLVLSPHYGASKLRWCLENLPAVRDAASDGRLALGPLATYVVHQLLDERPIVTDPANASRTQLWDPATRDWAPDLLALFGVDGRYLPRPVASRHDFGTLPVGKRRVPLIVCTGDQSAVPFAFGPMDPDTAYVNVGTGAFIQCELPADDGSGQSSGQAWPLLTSVVWADETRVVRVLEGSVNGASSALDWLSEADGIDAQRMLGAMTLSAAPLDTPVIFLNGVSGLASPFWIPGFPTAFIGDGDERQRFLAVLESILFLLRVNVDEMQRHRPPLQRIVVTGGLAASDLLCQRLADLVTLPVIRHGVLEATARGLAWLTAGQPRGWTLPGATRFEAKHDTGLLERFFRWLKEMKRASGSDD
jgi:glycerol kinase